MCVFGDACRVRQREPSSEKDGQRQRDRDRSLLVELVRTTPSNLFRLSLSVEVLRTETQRPGQERGRDRNDDRES